MGPLNCLLQIALSAKNYAWSMNMCVHSFCFRNWDLELFSSGDIQQFQCFPQDIEQTWVWVERWQKETDLSPAHPHNMLFFYIFS